MKNKLFNALFTIGVLIVLFGIGGNAIPSLFRQGADVNNTLDMLGNEITNVSGVNTTNVSASYLYQESNLVLDQGGANWSYLQNYPTYCPSGAVTGINDTMVCTDSWVDEAGDTMTGDLNMSNNNFVDVDCINFTSGGQICDSP